MTRHCPDCGARTRRVSTAYCSACDQRAEREIRMVTVPQVGGGRRILAMTAAEARRVCADRAYIDCADILGCVDVADGLIECGHTGPHWRDVPAAVRAALLAEARS